MIYDYLTRKMERDSPLQNDGTNIDWSSACPPLHDLNPHICPSGQYLDDICSSRYRIHLNPSVRYEYCKPLLGGIEDEEDRDDCVKACVRYVSRDRGDCCKFECEEEVRTRLWWRWYLGILWCARLVSRLWDARWRMYLCGECRLAREQYW